MKKVIAKMGQSESKQKLQLLTKSVDKIRKDIRSGKITANDIERIREILDHYAVEIERDLSNTARAADVFNLEEQIEATRKELDSLQRESNLDLAAVPTNSFSRTALRNSTKLKNKNIRSIVDNVEEIRRHVQTGQINQDNYDRLQGVLAQNSQQLNSIRKKSKKEEIDSVQKLISSVSVELANKLPQSNTTKNQSTPETLPPPKLEEKAPAKQETPKLVNRNNHGNLSDIENKFETLKRDIRVAEKNKDKNRLRFLSESIQTLMTNLQMITVRNSVVNEQKKGILENNLIRSHQQISKIRRQISVENKLDHQKGLVKQENNEKLLDEVETVIASISNTLNRQNYKTELERFEQCKNKLQAIEVINEDVRIKKQQIINAMNNLTTVFTNIQAEDLVNAAEWQHFQYRIDLNKFLETSESTLYKKHKSFLLQVRDQLNQVQEVTEKIKEKKTYVLYNVENNIKALEQKMRENADNNGKKTEETVELRNKPPQNNTNNSLIEMLRNWCHGLNSNSSHLQELHLVLDQLNHTKRCIEEILKTPTIETQNGTNAIDLTKTETGKAKNNLVAVEPDSVSHASNIEDSVQVVTVRSKELNPVIQSLPPVRTQLENIQREVQTLHSLIENSRFSKDSQMYKDCMHKIQFCRNEVRSMSQSAGDGGKFGQTLEKYIDFVLDLLENNITVRKSTTTEDILVDIMSVSTRINDLGNKLNEYSPTLQDHESLENSLLEHETYLKNLRIAPTRTNLCKSRDEVLQQIGQHLQALDALRKNHNTMPLSEEEQKFNLNLKRIKEKVYRYSGSYRNVLYKTIENDLDKCWNNVEKVYKNSEVALKVKHDISNTKKILEQKSIKDQSYDTFKRQSHDKINDDLTEIKQNIASVERELAQRKPLTKEELDKLDARLTLSILGLDNIKDERFRQEKEKLYTEIHYSFARIQELVAVVRPKPLSPNTLVLNQFDEQQVAAEIIHSIQMQLDKIKPDIMTFVGLDTSPTFLELEEVLVRGTFKLDDLIVDKSGQVFKAKIKLMEEIHKYSDILEERIKQTETIENYEKEVNVILIKIDSFNGYLGDAEYSNLDEQIIKLKVNLGKLHVSQELIARKEACIKEVDTCMKKLNGAAKQREPVAGTLV